MAIQNRSKNPPGAKPKNRFEIGYYEEGADYIGVGMNDRCYMIANKQLIPMEELEKTLGSTHFPGRPLDSILVESMQEFTPEEIISLGIMARPEKKFTSKEHEEANNLLEKIKEHLHITNPEDTVFVYDFVFEPQELDISEELLP